VKLPIIFFVAGQFHEQRRGVHKLVTQLTLTRLNHTNRDIRILCKARCNYEARSSSADNDEVVLVGEKLLGSIADGGSAVSIDAIGGIGMTVHVGYMM
jgi:hypothetical protein